MIHIHPFLTESVSHQFEVNHSEWCQNGVTSLQSHEWDIYYKDICHMLIRNVLNVLHDNAVSDENRIMMFIMDDKTNTL